MIRVYFTLNSTEAVFVQKFLQDHGIPSHISNLPLQDAGQSPFIDEYPEIWVSEKEDLVKVRALLQEYETALKKPESFKPWICAGCQEENEGNFDACWKCLAEKPDKN